MYFKLNEEGRVLSVIAEDAYDVEYHEDYFWVSNFPEELTEFSVSDWIYSEGSFTFSAAPEYQEELTYAELRAVAYPPIGDQLDALFHAGVFPDEMAAQIQAVKDKYPKV